MIPRLPLLWKLLAINIITIAVVLLIVHLAIQYLAADYLMTLMEMYGIAPTDTHGMFLDAIDHALGWAALASLSAAVALSWLLTRRVLKPLSQMVHNTSKIAAGEYDARIEESSNDEVGQLARAFNEMADSLDNIQSLRRRMVIDAAHELRTPLTNIQGYLEALADGVVEPSTELLASLHEETTGLGRLVEDLLELARAESASMTLQRTTVDVGTLVDGVLKTFEPDFEQRGITVRAQARDGVQMINADAEKIMHVVRNLLQNAWQYTPEAGRVEVRTECSPACFKLTVANSGARVDAQDLPHLFERFYRTDKARRRAKGGAGIGLAIVEELVAAHGGEVGAQSTVDETSVWFSIPQ